MGDFNCWFKTPGKCLYNDDMKILYPKILEADIIVFSTPVYVDGLTSPMKNLIDRIIPLLLPYIEIRDGHCRHPRRGETKVSIYILVSSCGLWELDNFDPLLEYMKAFCRNASAEFAGALLRPHAGNLHGMLEKGAPIGDIFEAAKEAGRQLAKEQKMSPENLDIVSRELLPREMYIQYVNQVFQQVLKEIEK